MQNYDLSNTIKFDAEMAELVEERAVPNSEENNWSFLDNSDASRPHKGDRCRITRQSVKLMSKEKAEDQKAIMI